MTSSVYDTDIYKAVDKAGGVAALARALGVTRQSVYEWLRRGFAPPNRAIQIEELYGIPRAVSMDPRILSATTSAADPKVRAGVVAYAPRRAPELVTEADDPLW